MKIASEKGRHRDFTTIMEFIYLIIRLPLFGMKLAFLSALVLVLGGPAAIVWYGVFFPLSIVLGFPAAILFSVLRNQSLLSGYLEFVQEFFLMLPLEYIGALVDSYKNLFLWLFRGSDARSADQEVSSLRREHNWSAADGLQEQDVGVLNASR